MKVTDFVPVHGPNPRPRRLTRRQAVRLGALLPMAALAASACAPEPPPLIEGADNLSSGGAEGHHLQQILDRRAKAQLDGDEEAYLADLDSSNQELIAREKMVFANLRQFALADVRFITSRALPRPLGEGTDRYAFQPVIKVVKLTADDGPAGVLGPGEAYEYVLAKQGEKWVIADAVPLSGQEALQANVGRSNSPWNVSPLHVVKSGNVWLAADDTVDLDPFVAPAKEQARSVEAMWGKRKRFPGHVLFFSNDRETLRTWYDLGDSAEKFEGVQIPLFGVTRDGNQYNDVTYATRMVIFLPNIQKFSDDPTVVMRHEMVHAVTSRAVDYGNGVDEGAPRWAIEGFARYIEVDGDPGRHAGEVALAADALRSGRLKAPPLPDSEKFYEDKTIGENYAVGYSVFAFVEQAKGKETAIEFYAETVKFTEPFGQDLVETPAFDGICQRVTGMSSSQLLSRWADYVRAGG